jgi:hypothetical protein
MENNIYLKTFFTLVFNLLFFRDTLNELILVVSR